MKNCSKCKAAKPKSEFYADKAMLGGLHSSCIPCQREISRLSRIKHAEKSRAGKLAYYYANKKQMATGHKLWAQANRAKRRAASRRYYSTHQREMLSRGKAWRRANPQTNKNSTKKWRAANLAKSKALIKDWARRNPERRHIHSLTRRARKSGGSGVTVAQWTSILSAYENRCAYCGKFKKLTMDLPADASTERGHAV